MPSAVVGRRVNAIDFGVQHPRYPEMPQSHPFCPHHTGSLFGALLHWFAFPHSGLAMLFSPSVGCQGSRLTCPLLGDVSLRFVSAVDHPIRHFAKGDARVSFVAATQYMIRIASRSVKVVFLTSGVDRQVVSQCLVDSFSFAAILFGYVLCDHPIHHVLTSSPTIISGEVITAKSFATKLLSMG